MLTISILVLNKKQIMESFIETKQAEEIENVTYLIYDNKDETKMKMLITLNSENGIEYIEKQNEDGKLTKVTANGKNKFSFDCEVAKDSNYTFKIKENGETERTETILADYDFILNHILVKLEKENGGIYYKEFEINKNDLNEKSYDQIYYTIGVGNNAKEQTYTARFSVIDYNVLLDGVENSDGTVKITAKAVNSQNKNEVTISKNYDIDTKNETIPEYTADSLLDAIDKYNYGSGTTQVTVTGKNSTEETTETYDLRVYQFDDSRDVTVNMALGIADDVATSSAYAKRMAVLKVNGDLTIDSSATLRSIASSSGYGGTKGLLIYCTGTLTNNGTINMTARGARAEGQNVYLWKNNDVDETYEYVPKDGQKGGTAPGVEQAGKKPTTIDAKRQSGGGGSGAASNSYSGGAGAKGTSYSGGTGGSGATPYSKGNAGQTNGRNGASGPNWYYNALNHFDCGGGNGAGNPGGSSKNASTGWKAANGTGGLITIYGDSVQNYGKIISNGSAGSKGDYNGGGGSGAGSINIFYKSLFTKGTLTANGGTRRTRRLGR